MRNSGMDTLLEQAKQCAAAGDNDGVLAAYAAARQLHERGINDAAYVQIALIAARTYRAQRETQAMVAAAREVYEIALSLSPVDMSILGEAMLFESEYLYAQGEIHLAAEGLRKVVAIVPKTSVIRANALLVLATVNVNTGNAEISISYLQEAAQLWGELKRLDKLVQTYALLGSVYFQLDNKDRAAEYLHKGLEYVDRCKSSGTVGMLYTELGRLFLLESDPVRAFEYFYMAQDVYSTPFSPVGQMTALSRIGELNAHIGDYQEALASFQQAASLINEYNLLPHRFAIYNNLGLCHYFLEQYDTALELLAQALELLKLESGDAIVSVNTNRARALWKKGDIRQAYDVIRGAKDTLSDPTVVRSTLIDCHFVFAAIVESLRTQAPDLWNSELHDEAFRALIQLYRHKANSALQTFGDVSRLVASFASVQNDTALVTESLQHALDHSRMSVSPSMHRRIAALKERRSTELLLREKEQTEKVNEQLRMLASELERRVDDRTKELAEALNRERNINKNRMSLIALISHELRTPISAITSATSMMLRSLQSGRSLDAGTVARLTKNYDDGVGIINQMLTSVSSIITYHEHIPADRWQDIALPSLCDFVVAVVSARQRVVIEIPVVNVYSKRSALTIILTQLLKNASQCSHPESIIHIRLVQRSADTVVEVVDTGIGVKSEEKNSIFEWFTRGSEVVEKSLYPGLGLGLSIAKDAAIAINAQLWHEENPHGGSIFAFSIPNHESQVSLQLV